MINELCKKAYDMAVSKGWYDEPRSALERQMLMVSEIAEACECARSGEPPLHYGILESPPNFESEYARYHRLQMEKHGKNTYLTAPFEAINRVKPEGELVELADAMIRIFDYCGSKGWDLEEAIRLKMEYNATRPYRHGNKLA